MSIKLYNGFRFRNADLVTILGQLRDLQKEMLPVATELYMKTVAALVVERIDRKHYEKKQKQVKKESSLSATMREILDRQEEVLKGYRDPMVDWELLVSVLPHKGQTFGLLFTEHKAFREAVAAKKWFEDYGYWDNTDRDEDVSKEDWRRRRNDWNAILPGNTTPAERGFSFEVIRTRFMPCLDTSRMLTKQPTIRQRAGWIAQQVLLNKWSKKNKITIGPHNIVRALGEFQQLVSPTGAQHEAYLKECQRYRTTLKRITRADTDLQEE